MPFYLLFTHCNLRLTYESNISGKYVALYEGDVIYIQV